MRFIEDFSLSPKEREIGYQAVKEALNKKSSTWNKTTEPKKEWKDSDWNSLGKSR